MKLQLDVAVKNGWAVSQPDPPLFLYHPLPSTPAELTQHWQLLQNRFDYCVDYEHVTLAEFDVSFLEHSSGLFWRLIRYDFVTIEHRGLLADAAFHKRSRWTQTIKVHAVAQTNNCSP